MDEVCRRPLRSLIPSSSSLFSVPLEGCRWINVDGSSLGDDPWGITSSALPPQPGDRSQMLGKAQKTSPRPTACPAGPHGPEAPRASQPCPATALSTLLPREAPETHTGTRLYSFYWVFCGLTTARVRRRRTSREKTPLGYLQCGNISVKTTDEAPQPGQG